MDPSHGKPSSNFLRPVMIHPRSAWAAASKRPFCHHRRGWLLGKPPLVTATLGKISFTCEEKKGNHRLAGAQRLCQPLQLSKKTPRGGDPGGWHWNQNQVFMSCRWSEHPAGTLLNLSPSFSFSPSLQVSFPSWGLCNAGNSLFPVFP